MENIQWYQSMISSLTNLPALYTYDGLQFKHMEMENSSQEDAVCARNCIRILSGTYGVLRPMDATQPYRLRMQTRLSTGECRDLYTYWEGRLVRFLLRERGKRPYIISLASRGYSKVICPYLCGESTYTVTFPIEKASRLKTESTQMEMARGAMVNWITTQRISTAEEPIVFHADGYACHKELSKAQELVFMKRR